MDAELAPNAVDSVALSKTGTTIRIHLRPVAHRLVSSADRKWIMRTQPLPYIVYNTRPAHEPIDRLRAVFCIS
ncbi:hypothetical protein COMA2_20255 [Candidatus Nitrospira nitrificans]|uniref:Uncharacterized protein n=1 Tax=Candidatus Nitrospira nitrificans TaxID=1742973 RepID=A0A0S4LCP0_9BACT|nr:hypothetical protein COMA2_20255 [Candidatus Nitrospira nitrificans]